jgi:hypothetical protein
MTSGPRPASTREGCVATRAAADVGWADCSCGVGDQLWGGAGLARGRAGRLGYGCLGQEWLFHFFSPFLGLFYFQSNFLY